MVVTMRQFQGVDTSRFTHSRTQKHKFLLGDEGALPPAIPINPYLWGAHKKMVNFLNLQPLYNLPKMHFYTKISFGGSPEASKVPGVSN